MVAGVAALGGIKNPFLKDGEAGARRAPMHDYAALAFAVATMAGVSGGVWVRTHDLLSPSPAAVQARWEAAGFDGDTAARIALALLTGITVAAPPGQDGGGTLAVPDDAGDRAGSVLFSLDEAGACQRTDPRRAPSAAEALRAWQLAPGSWPQVAREMENADLAALRVFWQAVCEEGER